MKRHYFAILLSVFLMLLFVSPVSAREINPIVSTEWLAANLMDPGTVVIDIRKIEEYREGHIPGAVSAYYGIWISGGCQKHLEYPQEDDLFEAIGDLGIHADSYVVIVCQTYHCFFQVMAPRVLCTLRCAGLESIGILDGGHEKWVREKRALSTEWVVPKETVYQGRLNMSLHADKAYVASRLGKAVFVDVREPALFRGEKKQEFAKRAGHIPGAVNLPASEAFTKLGTFKKRQDLEALAAKAVGSDRSREIITYCDAGKCCPTWALILSQVLGYKNVRLYDGSFEEWTKDTSLPVTR